MKMDFRRTLRILALLFALLTCIVISLLLAQHIIAPIIIWLIPSWEQPFYDLGAYGSYRAQTYITFNLASPWMSTPKWHPSCDHGYVFLDLSGTAVPNRGPAILHPTGELIYTSDQFGISLNSAIRTYQGQNYLTFWAGKKAKTSGEGYYYMLDSEYRVVRKISAVGEGVYGDLHEFKITPEGTALMTVYNATQADLSSMGWFHSSKGWITDGIFQEVDIATGKLLFEWRASDYFTAADSFMWNPFSGFSASAPFDFFHINSIDKDSRGNYLISARHLHILVYIDGKTGQPIWAIGGRSDDFEDLSDGQASHFSWQHDARWVSEQEGIISLFDNGMAWPHVDAPYSRGRMIQINETERTVVLLHTYDSTSQAHSSSQGSMQILSDMGDDNDTHVFLGWGSSAIMTEHSLDGQLLCEKHYGSSAYFFWERVKSYRAFKHPTSAWSGQPAGWDPVARIHNQKIYVSWNGATTVVYWELQGTKQDLPTQDSHFESVDVLAKDRNFESSFLLPDEKYTSYRVVALDAEKKVLRFSNMATPKSSSLPSFSTFVIVLGLIIAVTAITFFCVRKRGLLSPRRMSPMTWFSRHKYQKLW